MIRSVTAVLCAASLCGCASLNLRPTDGTGSVAAKVGARVVVCVFTLCLSELSLAAKRAEERYTLQDQELSAGMERWRMAAWRRRPKPTDSSRSTTSMRPGSLSRGCGTRTLNPQSASPN